MRGRPSVAVLAVALALVLGAIVWLGRGPGAGDGADAGAGARGPTGLREVVHDGFFPLAKECYSQLSSRKEDAGGTLLLKVVIVGDEKVGGVVDDVEVETEAGSTTPSASLACPSPC